MSAHSKLSASSCERWWNCPGSVHACASTPNPPSKYSAEGTVAHGLGEQVLRMLLRKGWDTEYSALLESKIGVIISQDGFEIEINEEMVESVKEYVEYAKELVKQSGPTAVVEIEQRVELKETNKILFGTSDFRVIVPYVIVHAVDFKYGQGKRVSAWKNKQGAYYLVDTLYSQDCPKFKIHICQPRVEDGFTSYEGTAEELAVFEQELKTAAERALAKDAPLVPGDWCKATFCPNRTACKALSGLARYLTVKDFDELPVVDVLTMEQITRVLKYEDTVKDWMSKVRDHAKELMLQGVEIPGYKVVQSVGNAKWIDEEAIKAEFEEEFGDRLYEKRLLSPAKFEKLAGKKRLGKEFRETYTVRPENGFKVVDIDEKGEIVKKTKAQEDFE